jgi:hypothetical protein
MYDSQQKTKYWELTYTNKDKIDKICNKWKLEFSANIISKKQINKNWLKENMAIYEIDFLQEIYKLAKDMIFIETTDYWTNQTTIDFTFIKIGKEWYSFN